MVIGKWMSSSGLMCIPCHTFQSFIKIKIQLSAQWTPVDAWFYLRYGNCCFQPSRRRKMLLQFVFAILWELCVRSTVNVEPARDAELGAGSAKSRKVDSYAQIASFLFWLIGNETLAHFWISFWIAPSPIPQHLCNEPDLLAQPLRCCCIWGRNGVKNFYFF